MSKTVLMRILFLEQGVALSSRLIDARDSRTRAGAPYSGGIAVAALSVRLHDADDGCRQRRGAGAAALGLKHRDSSVVRQGYEYPVISLQVESDATPYRFVR